MLIADVNRSKLKRMEIVIENTAEKDFFQTENLTREAFWNMYRPGCAKHLILHNLRKSRCFVALLDRVAVMDGKLDVSIENLDKICPNNPLFIL